MDLRTTARTRDLPWLAGALATSFGAAALGGGFTTRSLGAWYRSLRKPRWTPPDRVFGPVWTILYVQMAVAAWLIRRGISRRPERAAIGRAALAAWIVQLALNVSWSAVFFGRRNLLGGVWVIAGLWPAIAATATLASRISRMAGLLLLPYLAWTSFAAALTLRIWQLNKRR